MERWLPVAGYEDLYEVSDQGQVRSLSRQTASGIRGGRILKHYTGPGTRGYPQVALSRDGKPRNVQVHSLVLRAFAGPCPPGYEARHGPGGKIDASLFNLCWGTRAENIADRIRDGQDCCGERSGQAKLTWEKVRAIRRRVANGEFQSGLADEYGVCKQTVCLVVHNKTWIET